jgi:hypothetical protein
MPFNQTQNILGQAVLNKNMSSRFREPDLDCQLINITSGSTSVTPNLLHDHTYLKYIVPVGNILPVTFNGPINTQNRTLHWLVLDNSNNTLGAKTFNFSGIYKFLDLPPNTTQVTVAAGDTAVFFGTYIDGRMYYRNSVNGDTIAAGGSAALQSWVWRGTFSNANTYAVNNLVRFENTVYICTTAVTQPTQTPNEAPEIWDVFVEDGASAYALAVAGGFSGTEAEWLASLAGASAYEVAVANGFSGTELEWLGSLEGTPGVAGVDGDSWTYEIGEYVPSQGGVIFHRYRDGSNENYLIVAINDANTSAVWSTDTSTSLNANSTWDGATNYSLLQTATSGQFTSAAYNIIMWSSGTGVSGWYLPAIHELKLLWQNIFNVNKTLSGNSSYGIIVGATKIGPNVYWSSTESVNFAWYFFFYNGLANPNNKDNTNHVRAVRQFTVTP